MSMEGFNTESFNTGVEFEGVENVPAEITEEVANTNVAAKKMYNVVDTVVAAGYDLPEGFEAEFAGKEVSTSEFCRIVFTALNISRREISDKFDIKYRTVYGACANMENTAPEVSKGRSTSEATVKVSPEGKVYAFKDGVQYLDGEVVDNVNLAEFTSVNRKEFIQEKVAEGMSNADIAKLLQVSHGVVYNATKDMEGRESNREVIITLEDGSQVKRAEYIRQLFAEGMERKDIAKKLECAYNIVYAATKVEKSEAEKLAAAIEAVEKFADKVEDVESFNSALAILKLAVIATKSEEAEVETEETEITE